MIFLLAKRFIKNYQDYAQPPVRKGYGILCSVVGILLNILLGIAKFVAGTLSGSIAITADATNNLSDAASSLITLIGFWFSGKAPDPEHPFGHGRIEYLAGLAVSMLILWMGADLGISSIKKLFHPEEIEGGAVVIIILAASILVKLYMWYYNKQTAKKIDSAAMSATAADSISDAVSTLVVLVCTILAITTGLHADGICGIFVSVLILRTGIEAAKDTISPLLGEPPTKEFVESIEKLVLSDEKVVGVHDLVVHNYGPGRLMISLHAEVPGNEDIFLLHDSIDNIERELAEKFQCEAVIHMDPIAVNDEAVAAMRRAVSEEIKKIDEIITIHDFRMVQGPTHTNLIFDAVVPFSFHLSDDELKAEIDRHITENFEHCFAVVKIDKSYV